MRANEIFYAFDRRTTRTVILRDCDSGQNRDCFGKFPGALSESPKMFCGRGDEALSHRTSLLPYWSLVTDPVLLGDNEFQTEERRGLEIP